MTYISGLTHCGRDPLTPCSACALLMGSSMIRMLMNTRTLIMWVGNFVTHWIARIWNERFRSCGTWRRALTMEAGSSSETPVSIYHLIWRRMPQDLNLHRHLFDNLKHFSSEYCREEIFWKILNVEGRVILKFIFQKCGGVRLNIHPT